ncbi:MAG: Na+/H+ antiporter NhaA, partial [Flavobacteriaceae bacterium]|nr:Na+/H+ antiporter NhaA [Flavobacteriaceae bacterium]
AIFPVTAALSGAILPALIFWFMNKATPHINGWAIPMATDIAFVIGILAILAPRVPSWVKLFAITVAVVDDLIAILVIAFFYTEEINWIAMGVAGICVLVLLFFNYRNVNRLTLYLTVGFFLWWAVLGSGIHATIAGVILAFTIPLHREWELEEIKKSAKQSLELFRKAKDETLPETTTLAHHALEKTLRNMESPLKRLERKLHTPVYFIIMPLFAFVNAGIGFDGDVLKQAFLSSLTWGVILGLLGGKQAGILLAVLIFLKFFLTQRDNDRQTWMIFLGLSLLCGIGFTMSLFITNLSFTDPTSLEYAKLGVLVVSLVNALLGYFVLYRATLNPENKAIQ